MGSPELGSAPFLTRREFVRAASAVAVGMTLAPRQALAGPPVPPGEWLAGDLHCHTVYSRHVASALTGSSHRVGLAPAEQIRLAESRGLDFLAITDHDTLAHVSDAGYRSEALVLIPGYEHSLRHGHAGILGVSSRFGEIAEDERGLAALRDAVGRAGGVLVANHPRPPAPYRAWRYASSTVPHAAEVWNGYWGWHDQSGGLTWWERSFAGTGRRVAAVGGSDSHWSDEVLHSGVGQPTTWVYARERSWLATVEGIRAGRTTISAQPPASSGARVLVTATDGYHNWMIGDRAPPGVLLTLVVEVLNGQGAQLWLIADGKRIHARTVPSGDYVERIRARARRWMRAELRRETPIALTGPIYLGR